MMCSNLLKKKKHLFEDHIYNLNKILWIDMTEELLLTCVLTGVWFMHCHLDVHTSWGLRMAWIVLDGPQPNQKLPPPPSDLPMC